MFPHSALVLVTWLPIILGQTDVTICPDGWERFQSSCYLFADELLSDWAGAASFCSAHHQATLAVIESPEEDRMLTDHLHKLYKQGADTNVLFWLWASDDEIEGSWKWYTNDKPFASGYVNWYKPTHQPSNDHNQDCLCYWGPLGFVAWHDHHCEVKSHAICERNSTTTDTPLEIVGRRSA